MISIVCCLWEWAKFKSSSLQCSSKHEKNAQSRIKKISSFVLRHTNNLHVFLLFILAKKYKATWKKSRTIQQHQTLKLEKEMWKKSSFNWKKNIESFQFSSFTNLYPNNNWCLVNLLVKTEQRSVFGEFSSYSGGRWWKRMKECKHVRNWEIFIHSQQLLLIILNSLKIFFKFELGFLVFKNNKFTGDVERLFSFSWNAVNIFADVNRGSSQYGY